MTNKTIIGWVDNTPEEVDVKIQTMKNKMKREMCNNSVLQISHINKLLEIVKLTHSPNEQLENKIQELQDKLMNDIGCDIILMSEHAREEEADDRS